MSWDERENERKTDKVERGAVVSKGEVSAWEGNSISLSLLPAINRIKRVKKCAKEIVSKYRIDIIRDRNNSHGMAY